MIQLVSDLVVVGTCCQEIEHALFWWIRIAVGRREFTTSADSVPRDTPELKGLVESWELEVGRYQSLSAVNHLAELGPYVPDGHGAALARRHERQRELDRIHYSALERMQQRMDSIKSEITQSLRARPVSYPLVFHHGGRYYALNGARLWSSKRHLSSEQWLGLIAQAVSRERAKVESATAGADSATDKRSPIPSAVRIEVWRRDRGECVRCGSRDRLEFDHIIPVALGGGCTARNIELLCESCNRSKSASIG